MPIQTRMSGIYVRLAARARLCVISATLVAASVRVAAAAPMTESFSFDLFPTPFAKFDTSLGTLLSIDLQLDSALTAIDPFNNGGTNMFSCIANFTGGSLTVTGPGTPALLTVTGGGMVTAPCGQFEVDAIQPKATATVDPSLFGVFSSAGPSPITLTVTAVGGDVLFVEGAGIMAATSTWDPRLTSGSITYTYCPVGQDCSAAPPPPSVPEPATATMLAIGLAGMVGGRRLSR